MSKRELKILFYGMALPGLIICALANVVFPLSDPDFVLPKYIHAIGWLLITLFPMIIIFMDLLDNRKT